MEGRELSLEELEHVETTPNKEYTTDNALKNKNIFRQSQIEELKKLKERVLTEHDENKSKGSR